MKKVFASCLVALLAAYIALPTNADAKAVVNYTPEFGYKTLGTGITMSYVEIGDKKGSPVVLIHGATDSYISFSQVGAYLAAKGYRVYIPELRGHGNTDKPLDGPYLIDILADDIDAWMNLINLDKAHFVGHSLGSFVAQEMAISFPARVKSLTLIGSSYKMADNPAACWLLFGDEDDEEEFPFPGLYELSNLLGMDGVMPGEVLEWWTYSDNHDPLFVEYTYNHAERLPLYSWINTFEAALSVDNTDRLSAVTVPVLIIWGDEDDFFLLEEQIALQELLGSDKILFLQKAGGSHNVHWDGKMGEEIAGDIDRFLNGTQNGNNQGDNNNNQGGNGNSQGGNGNSQGGNGNSQ